MTRSAKSRAWMAAQRKAREDMAEARRTVLERDGCCQYCGAKNKELTVDHIFSKPDSRRLGISRTDPEWMVAACADDNLRRSTRHLLPPSWSGRKAELDALTPNRKWRVWAGGPSPREVLRAD